jgi:hypothetical protein
MVDSQLADKFVDIYRQISQKGDVFLFAMVKMDELSDKWSIIISAPWIDLAKKSETFDYVRGLMKQKLNTEELLNVARIGIFGPTSPLVSIITSAIRVDSGSSRLQNTRINGYLINDAYIFKSISPQIK